MCAAFVFERVCSICHLIGHVRVLLWAVLLKHANPTQHLLATQLDTLEFENMFRDSGYWDFFLLSFYDNAFRVYAIYAVFVTTDYSVVERASWAALSYVLKPLAAALFVELRSLEEFFLAALLCLFLFAGGVSFFTAVAALGLA